jgi:hypothetical protein
MSEQTTTSGASENGVGPMTMAVPEEVKEELERGIASMPEEQRQKAIMELETMLALTRGAVAKASSSSVEAPAPVETPAPPAPVPAETPAPAPVQAPPVAPTTPAPAPAPAPASTSASDPYPDPPFMVESREIAYLWSQEAIEKSAYLVTHDEWKRAHPKWSIEDFRYLMVGDKIKRFRPLDGYLLEADGGGDSGMPVVFKWLAQQPLLVAAASGQIVESKGATNVVVHACHSLHKLIPLLQFDGVIHGRVRPVGWQTALSGVREWMFLLWVEPDEADPRKPKLISLESALGKSSR